MSVLGPQFIKDKLTLIAVSGSEARPHTPTDPCPATRHFHFEISEPFIRHDRTGTWRYIYTTFHDESLGILEQFQYIERLEELVGA